MGGAIAFALANAGLGNTTTVLEKGSVGNGFSSLSSGIVRCHYGHPALVSMALASEQLFAEAQERLGADIGFRPVGYALGVGEADTDALAKNVSMQQGMGVDTEIVAPEQIAEVWPGVERSDLIMFAYEERGGYGDGYLTAQGLASAAKRRGTVFRQESTVEELVTSSDVSRVHGVRLRSGEAIEGDVVVMAAGPWSRELCNSVGLNLPIVCHREQKLLLHWPAEGPQRPVLADRVRAQYLRPGPHAEVVYGTTRTDRVEPVDPDHFVRTADDEYVVDAGIALSGLFGRDDISVAGSYAGCYDLTPDLYPIIGTSGVDGLMLCVGFSGHGFKLSAAVGRLVADLIVDGKSSSEAIPSELFQLSRFSEGRSIRSLNPYSGSRY